MSDKCDTNSGPCACGAWHHPLDQGTFSNVPDLPPPTREAIERVKRQIEDMMRADIPWAPQVGQMTYKWHKGDLLEVRVRPVGYLPSIVVDVGFELADTLTGQPADSGISEPPIGEPEEFNLPIMPPEDDSE